MSFGHDERPEARADRTEATHTRPLEVPFDRGVLRRLSPADAPAYFAAVQRNRDHLTARGDYLDEVAASVDDFRRRFADDADLSILTGIWQDDVLVGHVGLLHREPPKWGLGYWLALEATGRGVGTAAVGALLEFGRRELGVEEVLAGVTHGNGKSVALLTRLGFEPVADFETYTRFGKTFAP